MSALTWVEFVIPAMLGFAIGVIAGAVRSLMPIQQRLHAALRSAAILSAVPAGFFLIPSLAHHADSDSAGLSLVDWSTHGALIVAILLVLLSIPFLGGFLLTQAFRTSRTIHKPTAPDDVMTIGP